MTAWVIMIQIVFSESLFGNLGFPKLELNYRAKFYGKVNITLKMFTTKMSFLIFVHFSKIFLIFSNLG